MRRVANCYTPFTLLTFTFTLLLIAGRAAISIDISRRYDTQQQTRRTPLLLLIDETDRQTGGQTLDRFIDPAPHTVRAVAIA